MASRTADICFALQSLHLPAFLLMCIAEEACANVASYVPDHVKWNMVVAIKHFKRGRNPATDRRESQLCCEEK
jgi:hypothetical protein